MDVEKIKNLMTPKKDADKQFFMDLLDDDLQSSYEADHISAVMDMLRIVHIKDLREKRKAAEEEKDRLQKGEDYTAEKYRRVLELDREIAECEKKIEEFKPFFADPYFGRMDLVDDKDGYNSYYIGKKGDMSLEIVDWRAPLARRYYQKSCTSFSINEYDYKLILRRAIRTSNGKVVDFKNEYLNLSDYLDKEEIAGRDETIVSDPFLKEILRSRKEEEGVSDIIETIQEKQYEVITLPEKKQFVLQGVAGSGKTMVLLHRLSYILYNDEKTRPSDILVITPSDAFNDFINELSVVLELDSVRTCTVTRYFLDILKIAGVDVESKVDPYFEQNPKYLEYVYSEKFRSDAERKIKNVFDGIYELFRSDECLDFIERIQSSYAAQYAEYSKIMTSSYRVRRAVFGELKEKKEGGLRYTKDFREMFSSLDCVNEFFKSMESDEKMKGCSYFLSTFMPFYKAAMFVSAHSARIMKEAAKDLDGLKTAVRYELDDLVKQKSRGFGDLWSTQESIDARRRLLSEIEETQKGLDTISDNLAPICDFFDVLRCDPQLAKLGNCASASDVLKYFYGDIVKPAKKRCGVPVKPLVQSDPYCMCYILMKLGYELYPKHSFVFVDEAQDISEGEYAVLFGANGRATFNIFGDLKQNIAPYRGLKSWDFLNFDVYTLEQNYRNTNNIVNYVSGKLDISMVPIGVDGEDVQTIPARGVTTYLSKKKGLKALICSESNMEKYSKSSYNVVRRSGKVSKRRVNLLTVAESKGLEFGAVAVADGDLTDNEKYIAYTRALSDLVTISD